MYAEERQRAIAQQVRDTGRASVADLAGRFDVTSETVRRDLAVLERGGYLQRVHGGAVRAGITEFVAEQDLDVRAGTHSDIKTAIATAALDFLPPDGGSLIVDAGTTTYQAALALPATRALTLITNSIPVSAVFAGHENSTLYTLGGRVRGLTQAAVGADTVSAVEHLRTSTAFIGTNGLTVGHGLSTPDPDEAAVKAAFVRVAARVVVLADSSKVGREDLCSFAGVDDVDVLITDSGIDPTIEATLISRGVEVITV